MARFPVNALLSRETAGGGSHRGGSNSVSGIISTLVPVFIVAAIGIVLFLLLKKKYGKVYRPRTDSSILWQKNRRMPNGHDSFFSAVTDFKGLADTLVMERNCIDGYLFLRFFKVLIAISLLGCIITWPILFPVNATGQGEQSGLDILSFSNVANPNRYYAHALCAWVFLGLVTLIVGYERMTFIGLRQAYLLSPLRAERLTSRTILVMSLSKEEQSMEALKEKYGQDVRHIWMATDCEDLEEMVQDRDDAGTKLETGQIKLLKDVEKRREKSEKNNDTPTPTNSQEDAKKWKDEADRPQHRLKPIIGRKVDTLTWSRAEIQRLSKEIAHEQERHGSGKADLFPAAFIEFKTQAAAQRAYHNTKGGLKSRQQCFIDVQPDEIIWDNLKVSYAAHKAKLAVATALIVAVTIFWTPIVAFIGTLTNINYLTREVPFLSFINNIPDVILGVVTGLLPTLILALCVILVPIICRLLSKKVVQDPTLSAVELRTQTWYFIFQVIQVFLVTTFTSGASAVAAQIVQQPTSALTLLAQNLPKASNFYLSYFILYGLAQAAFQLLSVIAALSYVVLGKFMDKTPRTMYNRWIGLAGLGWGSEYPKWTNLGVIAISYSCISPLVLGFSTLGFLFLYIAFRYKWLFVLGNQVDMKGEAFSRALQQLMTGVYLSCLCLIGLFAIGSANSSSAVGPLVLMIILLVAIIAFQIILDIAIAPLEQEVPQDLASSKYHSQDVEANSEGEQSPENREDSSRHNEEHQRIVGNKLTTKIRPYIDRKFYEPKRDFQFELPEEDYEYQTAYLNPAIYARDPFIWLARDSCGVSKLLVEDNKSAGINSSDDYAWFQDGKVHWNTEKADVVSDMLENDQKLRQDSEKDESNEGQDRPQKA